MAAPRFSVGMHHSSTVVDVHVAHRMLEVWAGSDLITTIVRASAKEVRT